jgi:acetyltransferase (GNAT) family protein
VGAARAVAEEPVGDGALIRVCRPGDRGSIERLGHPPAIADMFCPPRSRRIAWRLLGTRAVSLLAQEAGTGSALGSVQFVRSRRSPDTWMFGHWRILAGRRRQGWGRRILAEGLRLLPQIRRLYSLVDVDNEASMAAHRRLGFEAGSALWGSAPLGVLSTIGPATPALRLEPVAGRDWSVVFAIYARSMGSLWLRLFPGLGQGSFLGGERGGLRAGVIAVARGLSGSVALSVRAARTPADRPAAGFVLWEGAGVTLFAEPATCDQAFLARVALQLLGQGARRDLEVELRGLPRLLTERPGPIRLRALMGMPDVPTQWGRGLDGEGTPPQ